MESSSVSAVESQRFILLPLYIYPDTAAWEPLFSAVLRHPNLQFTVVVNPANGPGNRHATDANYTASLLRLSSLANVTILGYVYCSYGERPLEALKLDIKTYRGWCGEQSIQVDGIFFDEAPSGAELVEYMAEVAENARETLGDVARGGATTVIYNPGVFVDQAYYCSADYIAVFENRVAAWDSAYVYSNLDGLPDDLRARSIAIGHSAGDTSMQMHFAEQVACEAGFAGHFATTVGGYTQWCPNWAAYVRRAGCWAEAED
ncbi:Spherulation-specific family 4 [Lasiosphaeria miniovina]|uniref:Spherulation-specific family 4 n=1 Tax=Lasiosphaeria miniovina TaxID=1954250 RepID=A0AA40E9D8_9PEZI|nr:Spherulation-specific family 4 [Lasiosphaeria miniovina]KAK0733189.1 Spherulation-specific family 4 [Lasiosphaeria miniovina]